MEAVGHPHFGQESGRVIPISGVQTVITGGYWLKPLTTNRLGGGGYFYNRRLAVIKEITGGFITAFQFGFWAGFGPFLGRF
jgi:hypothetical protein